ncbi:hypothetical protein CZP2022_13 [Vibrio phage C-ZP2022]|nr:hypothetical protein CZP2022_13 [Vibrio phage C-ZP2022]
MSIFGAILTVVVLAIMIVAFMLKVTSLNDKTSTNPKADLELAYNKAVGISIWIGNRQSVNVQKVLNRCKGLNKSKMEFELRRVLVHTLCQKESAYVTSSDFDSVLLSAIQTVRARHGL